MEDQRPAGIILAGGRSRRFGSDKASALLSGRPLLQWSVDALSRMCSEVIIVAARDQTLPPVEAAGPLRSVRDPEEYRGPLAAMVTGFELATAELCVVVSCDAPLVKRAVLQHLCSRIGGADVACANVGGKLQPLAAVYRRAPSVLVFRECVSQGELGVIAALGGLWVVTVAESELRVIDPDLRSFMNVNTPRDLADVLALLR